MLKILLSINNKYITKNAGPFDLKTIKTDKKNGEFIKIV